MKNMNDKEKYMPILGILLGGAVFFLIYGYKILDPCFLEWTMRGDAAAHFTGWHFFRSEPWSFPLGLIQTYPYPLGTSVVYTDSIPLLAIPLKLLSPLLPNIFQYHGLWLLLCYCLQGYFSVLLMRRLTVTPLMIFAGSIFFLMSPVMVNRSAGHETLTGHWLILAALYLYFQEYDLKSKIKWVVLLVIAIMVHFYLFFMVLVILGGYLLKQLLEDIRNEWFSVIRFAAMAMAAVLFSMWVLGYFVIGPSDSPGGGLGYYSMNLLAPINPSGYSAFLRPLTLATEGQYEGFNYFGLGLLLLILTSIYTLFRRKRSFATKAHLPLILVAFVLFVIALSNKITFSDIVLFEYPLPYIVEKALGMIRSTGRIFWPVTYMLMFASIAVVIRHYTPGKAVVLLFVFAGVQVLDLSPKYKDVNYDKRTWTSPLKSHLWGELVENTKHIVFIPAIRQNDDYVPFAFLAANNGMTFNTGYTSRANKKIRKIYIDENIQEFKETDLRNDTLYVIRKGYFYPPKRPSKFIWGNLDGYSIVTPKPVKTGTEQITLEPWPFIVRKNDNKHTLCSLIKEYSVLDYAILLSVWDEAADNIPVDFVEIMKEMGSDIEKLRYRGSYAAIIMNGNLESEKINNSGKAVLDHNLFGHGIYIKSGRKPFCDRSTIAVNGVPLSLNRRGFNVVVLDLRDNTIERYNFDTHKYNDQVCESE